MIRNKEYLFNLFKGMYFGYPECCVSNFARLSLVSEMVAKDLFERYEVPWDKCFASIYVSCWDCFRSRRIIPPVRRLEYLEPLKRLFNINEALFLEKDEDDWMLKNHKVVYVSDHY